MLALNQDRFNAAEGIDANKLWHKRLVNEFYILESICFAGNHDDKDANDNHEKLIHPSIPPCEETLWSSLSPDPKSSISSFNQKLKTLV